MKDFDEKEFEPLGLVLRIPFRRRKPGGDGASGGSPTKGGGRATLSRMAAKAPEVMVKVSGGARGQKNLQEHLNYITRNGTLVAETPDGDVFGRTEVGETAAAWWSNRGQAQGARRSNSRETVNLVLSMPAGTDRDKFVAAARNFATRTFAGERDYLMVEHRDTEHPHVHLTLRTLGHDMRRLNPKKADLQAWREGLAIELREQGLVAEATPRRARGVVRKPTQQAIKHLDLRGASRVQRAKVLEAVREVSQAVARGERPWEEATKKRQAAIRSAWNKLADEYQAEGTGEGLQLATDIRRFVAQMPAVETERDQIIKKVRASMPTKGQGSGGRGSDREPDHEPER